MKLGAWALCFLLMVSVQHSAGSPAADYASVRAEVVKAYAQQAEEMAQALSGLQQVAADTSTAIKEIESACGK